MRTLETEGVPSESPHCRHPNALRAPRTRIGFEVVRGSDRSSERDCEPLKSRVYEGSMHSGVAVVAGDACFENLEALDRELARLAQKSGSLRLAIGMGLDALARIGGYTALGFPSLNAYALERCERSASWTSSTRRLSARVRELPLLRGALISGRISWSRRPRSLESRVLMTRADGCRFPASAP
jgi:hypothetical protein